MPGFTSITGDESIMFADNASFDGSQRGGKLTTNGQLWIGSTIAPHVNVGHLISPDGSITIGYASGNITLKGAASGVQTLAGDAGSATGSTITITGSTTGLTTSGAAATLSLAGTLNAGHGGTGAVTLTGILTGNGTSAFTASTVTQHGVLIGGASNAVSSTVVGSTGQVLQANSGTDPTYSTATFPSTATGTGTILRADGTNWAATTATYPATATSTGTLLRADGTNWVASTVTFPNTTTTQQILFSSSANVIGGITTANSGVLVTSATGVPSIQAGPGANNQFFQSNAGGAPTFTANPTASGRISAAGLTSNGDPGGALLSTTISNTSSSTISTGVGSVKMSSVNAATNTGWLKIYIGTTAAWIPTWTTNSP